MKMFLKNNDYNFFPQFFFLYKCNQFTHSSLS